MIINKNLIFFGELPPISRNGISYNNLRFLKKLKIYFLSLDCIRDLPHKSFLTKFLVCGKLFYLNYLLIKRKKKLVYFTLSQGTFGILKSLLVVFITKVNNTPYMIHLHRGDLIIQCKKSNLRRLLNLYILSNSSIILFISKNQEKETINYFRIRKNKCFFYPNLPLFDINNYYLHSSENKSRSNYKKLNLIYVGPVVQSKGIDILLEQLFKNRSNRLDFQINLSILGKNLNPSLINKYIEMRGNIKIKVLGEKRHKLVLNEISKSDIFILPSLSEGMPYVILEAIILNVPVICTKVGYISEILGENYPFYINLDDPDTINYHIEFIVKNMTFAKKQILLRKTIALDYLIKDRSYELIKKIRSII